MAQMATEKQMLKNRMTVLETEDTAQIGDEHPDKRKQPHGESHTNNEQRQSKEQSAHHPFKGNFVDFSG